jgi:hypothetical protein
MVFVIAWSSRRKAAIIRPVPARGVPSLRFQAARLGVTPKRGFPSFT